MTQATAYLGVARAPFLALPVALVACGAAVAAWEGGLSWPRTLLALLGLVALHVAVNVFNEVSDLRTGIDLRTTPTPFSGGSGTLPAAALSPRAVPVRPTGACHCRRRTASERSRGRSPSGGR